nr:PREDICTED: uncharacterized protein LOC108225885 [Daucus carota subsp. sativus]
MMLNPAKCAFGVGSGKLLRLMVSKGGIEANPEKIKAILDMELSKSIKDVQKLTRRITTLGRFISKSGDKCLPSFKALKKVKDFEWTSESQEAFEQLKKYMAEPPLLSKPIDGETLYVYLSEKALSAVLVREDRKIQKLVYYVSKILHGAELNYSVIEKHQGKAAGILDVDATTLNYSVIEKFVLDEEECFKVDMLEAAAQSEIDNRFPRRRIKGGLKAKR